MCSRFSDYGPNLEYERDLRRGRMSDAGRFYKLDEYAYRRWERSRDMRQANQWLKIMEAVKRRSPMSQYRPQIDRLKSSQL